MIRLQDILRFDDEEIDNVRVKLTMPYGDDDPKDIYLTDKEKINTNWFLYSGKKYNYFKKGCIAVSLMKIGTDLWILTTIKKIIDIIPPKNGNVWNSECYKTEVVEKYRSLFDRTYISYHKKNQSGRYKWSSICDELIVSRIENGTYNENTFTGYKFELAFKQLESIIKSNKKDWIDALSHIQAVYLITDNKTGKFYVGSATSSDDFLLTRWRTYIKNGHGGNIKLKELIKEKGFDYIKNNFSYRIIDYFGENYPKSKVIKSEMYWKDVFKSRIFGYNSN